MSSCCYPSNENIECDAGYLEDDVSKKIRVYHIELDNEEKTINKLKKIINLEI